ncbi:MAG: cell division protein ZapE [Legionellales bacterium RIFCSPHIGHO2_12_FULL_35_11]|nr:MAG: cell division protein ZapE [Legionellales bacterium RIFCSPHIGHO2_12_FULL_35_11]
MSLMEKYDLAVKSKDIQDDLSQRKVVVELDKLNTNLNNLNSWFSFTKSSSINGLYIMGPVGVGKTYLMDLFYNNLALKKKARFHFHHFMQQIDKKLRELQGHSDPIIKVVQLLAKKVKILCLDEFLINDVAYAMIMAQLLKALFQQKITLVVTTNTAVDELYLDGVGRERFLGAIELIKKNCELIRLHGGHDYRVGRGHSLQSYLFPLNNENNKTLEDQFKLISKDEKASGEICILNRPIPFVKSGNNSIWFEFGEICDMPRCQLDYLEIANYFDTIFISNIPVLDKKDTVKTLLFMHFVDVAYDRGIRLVLSAEVPHEKLYSQGELFKQFARTVSRLEEMQSEDYIKRHAYLGVNRSNFC